MPEEKEDTVFKELKPTRKGVVVVLVLLVVFPLLIDSLIFLNSKLKRVSGISLSKLLMEHYLKILPFFILYLLVALLCIYIYRKLVIS